MIAGCEVAGPPQLQHPGGAVQWQPCTMVELRDDSTTVQHQDHGLRLLRCTRITSSTQCTEVRALNLCATRRWRDFTGLPRAAGAFSVAMVSCCQSHKFASCARFASSSRATDPSLLGQQLRLQQQGTGVLLSPAYTAAGRHYCCCAGRRWQPANQVCKPGLQTRSRQARGGASGHVCRHRFGASRHLVN